MVVKRCKECPFFQETLFSLISRKAGLCAYSPSDDTMVVVDTSMPEGPARDEMRRKGQARLPIRDREVVPEACPLRTLDVVVTLGD
jgi:hypothetical protein